MPVRRLGFAPPDHARGLGLSDDVPNPSDGPDLRSSASAHPSTLDGGRASRRGPRWGMLAGVAGCVALLGSLLAFGLTRDPSAVHPTLIGTQAPGFVARTLDGSQTVRLSELRGQVVVLNFWSSWCAECVVEHPALAATWDRYRDDDVVVLGMNFDDAKGAAASFASRLGIAYPVLADPSDRTAIAFGVTGPPETFLIAPDGTIAGKHIGPVGYEQLSGEIDRLLSATP